ncbi:MAG: hypothetical protein U9O94_00770 [Nanoarchaeota archaeon]|nr:hypothetical protein [Nanoarchaeota archaeon]
MNKIEQQISKLSIGDIILVTAKQYFFVGVYKGRKKFKLENENYITIQSEGFKKSLTAYKNINNLYIERISNIEVLKEAENANI